MNFNDKYSKYLEYFNQTLNDYFDQLKTRLTPEMFELISYPLLNGGKRIRPVLLYATADLLGLPLDKVKNLALSLEMIHTYSLVHDDLPAMDNDDFRRGKLSTHKKFGEANGILSGDALLNLAIECALDVEGINQNYIDAVKFIFNSAGASGMILGQFYDLCPNKPNTEDFLFKIYNNKTGKLIIAPVLSASIIMGKMYYQNLLDFSSSLGVLFQITDDILDVEGSLESLGKTPNKDDVEDKLTAVNLYGIKKAKQLENEYYNKCKNSVLGLKNNEFLLSFVEYIYSRKN